MITSHIRKNKNSNLNLFRPHVAKLTFLLAVIFVLFFFITEVNSYFPIKAVKIYGVQHTDQKILQQGLIPFVSKGFFSIDVESIKDRLLQSAWVSKASVQRVWPDEVLISVVEKKPIAKWNNTSLISSNGEVFSPELNTYPEGLTELVGPPGQQIQILQYYKKLCGLFNPLHLKISRFEFAPLHTFFLTFNNGMKLSVGYKDVLTHLSHFVKVYPKIIGQRSNEIEYVDLRYPNGLAVKWKTVA